VFDAAVRFPEVTAIEPTVMLMWTRDEMLRHLQSHPRTAVSLLAEMSRRVRRLEQGMSQLALCDVNQRLIQCLVAIAREEGFANADGQLVIRRRPTQQELANMVGSCRETISRAYNQLGRSGMIIGNGRSLIITQPMIEKAEQRKIAGL
jgi:CRP/FNR family transcriptional regulator, cyclic AMP receptor protein